MLDSAGDMWQKFANLRLFTVICTVIQGRNCFSWEEISAVDEWKFDQSVTGISPNTDSITGSRNTSAT